MAKSLGIRVFHVRDKVSDEPIQIFEKFILLRTKLCLIMILF